MANNNANLDIVVAVMYIISMNLVNYQAKIKEEQAPQKYRTKTKANKKC